MCGLDKGVGGLVTRKKTSRRWKKKWYAALGKIRDGDVMAVIPTQLSLWQGRSPVAVERTEASKQTCVRGKAVSLVNKS